MLYTMLTHAEIITYEYSITTGKLLFRLIQDEYTGIKRLLRKVPPEIAKDAETIKNYIIENYLQATNSAQAEGI